MKPSHLNMACTTVGSGVLAALPGAANTIMRIEHRAAAKQSALDASRTMLAKDVIFLLDGDIMSGSAGVRSRSREKP